MANSNPFKVWWNFIPLVMSILRIILEFIKESNGNTDTDKTD